VLEHTICADDSSARNRKFGVPGFHDKVVCVSVIREETITRYYPSKSATYLRSVETLRVAGLRHSLVVRPMMLALSRMLYTRETRYMRCGLSLLATLVDSRFDTRR
jgi:hypothetical protein